MKFNSAKSTNPSPGPCQPSLNSTDQTAPVGWVSVWTIPEPTSSSEQEKEETTVEPADSQPDNESWLVPAPDADLPESGVVWYAGEDPGEPVSMEDLSSDSAFLHKRKEILATSLRGENHFDYDELSPLGAHCIKQLVAWIESARNNNSRLNLYGADLMNADLSRADLTGADLNGADLTGANLNGANLNGANLSRANLNEANFNEADLSRANLRGANLNEANLIEANLNGANLIGANLIEANLNEADLSRADLRGAYFNEADLRGANLTGANLSGADLRGAKFDE